MKKEIIDYLNKFSTNDKVQELLIYNLENILLKQDNLEKFIKENNDKIIHIRDWIISVLENNEEWKKPRVLTLDSLNNMADKYFEKQNNKIKKIELDKDHESLVADLDDYYIIQMLTPEALDNESKVMQHCIGHGYYDQNLNKNEYKYLSLRDRFNKAHVTLEIENNKIIQLQGKQNQLPDEKYLEILLPWLINNNYSIDLSRYKLIFNLNDNKIYSINNMPNNCIIDENLNLMNSNISKLPDNLVVNGDLYLATCNNLKELSKNIIINNDLYLNYSSIVCLPDDIKINGNLNLINSKIEKLSDNLKCKFLLIEEKHIDLINENMFFDKIYILEYCKYMDKEEFLELIKDKKNINHHE